jgi:putative DNA primase/helicase
MDMKLPPEIEAKLAKRAAKERERAKAGNGAGADLPAPHPLPDSLLPVDEFDFDLLPDKLRPWVADVCERMQCPPDFVAASLMAALGSTIDRKIAVRPQVHEDWQVIPNMWALLIGRPGVLKSPAMEEALRPLRKLAAIAEKEFEKAHTAWEVTVGAAKLRREERAKQPQKSCIGTSEPTSARCSKTKTSKNRRCGDTSRTIQTSRLLVSCSSKIRMACSSIATSLYR